MRIYRPDLEIQRQLDAIESTDDESSRQSAIQQLSRIPGGDATRALIDAYRSCLWRETKIAIIRAIGNGRNLRAFEFLTEIAADTDDLPMAAESLLALGATQLAVACAYLVGVAQRAGHPLQKEAIIGLAQNPLFDCETELLDILHAAAELSPTVVQYAILACARRRSAKAWPVIRGLLTDAQFVGSGPVFNASVLAAGMLASRDEVGFLRSLNTRYRFFADQLVGIAVQQIDDRASQRLEDLTTLLLASDTIEQRQDYALALQRWSLDQIRDEAAKQGATISDEIENLLLATRMHDELTRQMLLVKLVESTDNVNEQLAICIWNFTRFAAASELQHLRSTLVNGERQRTLEIWERAPMAFSLVDWLTVIADDLQPEPRRIAAINAVGSQARLVEHSDQLNETAKAMAGMITGAKPAKVRYRLIRALGQLRSSAIQAHDLVQLMKDDPSAASSVYMALGAIGHEDCAKQLAKRLRQMLGSPAAGELGACLRAIVECRSQVDVESLQKLTAEQRDEHDRQLLQILARYRVTGFDDLISAALNSNDYHRRMLGIAAAAVAGSESLLSEVMALTQHPNRAIAGRALHAICIGAPAHMQTALLQQYLSSEDGAAVVDRLFRMVVIHPPGDYGAMAKLLDGWIKSKGHEHRRENLNSAISLLDNILVHEVARSESAKNQPTAATEREQHAIDGSLRRALGSFDLLSDTIRSVLRNAELTFSNPELFNEQVDKSTVIVEFVKSIDLFLQEKLGGSLFVSPSRDAFTRLQSRVMHLQLDDETISVAKRLRDLQCASHFDVDNFPSHKMLAIARSVATGKILKDQYKAVDGLRAWSLILLMFGREFSFQNQTLGPLLPVKDSRNRNICEIAAVLNRLQEVRNLAAHRGTMLEQESLTQVRGDALKVLSRLVGSL